MKIIKKGRGPAKTWKMIWIGISLGALYWFLDVVIDVFVFHEGPFIKDLLTPEPMCAWMRFTNLFIVSIFAVYTQYLLDRRNQAEDELKMHHDHLEEKVRERTADLSRVNEQLLHEIKERKRTEAKLGESDAFIKDILETVGEGILVVDARYRIISANRAYCDSVKLCIEDVIDRHCYEVSHRINRPCYEAGEECPVKHTFETGNPYSALHTHLDNAGSPVYIETKSYAMKNASGKITAVIETIADITEKRQLEAQLLQAQKMEAIGQLAGGVAHDFNNILSAIMGYGSLLMIKMKEDDPLRKYVEPIIASAKGAANLTRSLLTFSRKEIINPRPVDLNEITKKMEKLLLRVIGEDIELKTRLIDEDLIVMADSGQMEQVLMNLCTNARDAMPNGGPLSINTGIAELDEEFIKTHGYGESGMYAVVSVTDKGTGMDEKTRSRIFEPFFTTKEIGRGTGLGLSIVYGIIKQHNGYINCFSEPEKETTFRIFLPLTKTKTEESDPPASVLPAGGTETILLAEDDASVRKITRAMLEEFGYKVIEATDGEEAIRTFADNVDNIRLLLFDLLMPRKNGKEAFEEIKKIRPGVKALFTSGYTADVIHGKDLFEQGLNLIPKPVFSAELLTRVREVLDDK